MIAVYFILRTLNLTNNHWGLVLVYSASSGLGYLIAKGFLDTVPVSLREAAYLNRENAEQSLINPYFTQFCAGGVLVSIPISVLFVIMQKFYVEGVTGGSVKG